MLVRPTIRSVFVEMLGGVEIKLASCCGFEHVRMLLETTKRTKFCSSLKRFRGHLNESVHSSVRRSICYAH